mmetsp:Transcript_18081/g.38638  ORF Transcript_18081/g.38638 Transcript_18081/m.38638 type:complete len:269 (-) Transcript_18081:112-918(-)
MSNVGRMDGAFFVSRSELINWVNNLLDTGITKVEQCSNGAVYCQIIDACHPGIIPMKKVNWAARDEHQCLPNYKVLQLAFDKAGIQRHMEVDKLVKGKYQDNLEMLQWIKTYHERVSQGGPYDGPSRRFGGDAAPEWAMCRGQGSQRPNSNQSSSNLEKRFLPAARARSPRAAMQRTPSKQSQTTPNSQMREEQERLRDEVVDLKITVDGLETERNFYFQKLRDIEILCQVMESRPDPNMTIDAFVGSVQRVLYARDDPDDDDDEDLP